MIERLNIKEFRGIRECEKEFELSKFTVLIGKNNSGKTAFLEAIYLLLDNIGVDPVYRTNRSAVVRDIHSGSPSSLVYGYSGVAEIEYSVNSRKLSLKIDDKGSSKLYIDDAEWKKDYEVLSKIFGTEPDSEAINALFLFISPHTGNIRDLIDGIKREHERITKIGAHISIIELVNKCINDKYTEIYLETLRVRKELPGNVLYIKLEDLGHGLVKTIPALLWIEALKPKVVLWDDFEISAHPSLIRILIEWLSTKDFQVIISTHSIDVLSELIDVRPKDATVLQLLKTDEDILRYTKLNLDDLEVIMEKAQHDPRLLTDALQI